jgi:DNA primase
LANATDYIEVAFCDIEAANGLAHEILGRSLDELSPQTRKLLGILQGMVRERREKNKIDFDQCLLSRREIREKTGWSQTQLKIHLDRLTDHEYLVARFGRRGQCYVYEVLFDGDIDQSKPQLNGLASFTGIFDETLNETSIYDAHLSGVKEELSGSKRPQNGSISGGYRGRF